MAYLLKDKNNEFVKYSGKHVLGKDTAGVFIKAVNMGDRTLDLIGTDESKDRDGDVITHKGWNFENYYKNPVFIWAHDYSSVPLARTMKIVSRPKIKRHDFTMKFPTEGLNPFADMILSLYNEKVINASSVGFIPSKMEDLEEESSDEDRPYLGQSKRFLEKELLELSGCPVPCNPNAVQELFANGKIFSGFKGKDIFDEYKKGNIPGLHYDDVLEELQVKDFQLIEKSSSKKFYNNKPAEGFKSFLVEEEVVKNNDSLTNHDIGNEFEEFISTFRKFIDFLSKDQLKYLGSVLELKKKNKKVGGASNLALADEGLSWDAAGAQNRARKWASSDGSGDKDKVDMAKYRKIFAWYDPGDSENYSAYKLPFADIIDGSPKAVWRGVAAGMAALLGARGGVNVPDSDRRPIYNFLSGYYRKFEKDPPDFKSFFNLVTDFITIENSANEGIDRVFSQKSGAVLNKKNMNLLSSAVENINAVIESAKKEDPDPLKEPEDKTAEGNPNGSSIYDEILKEKSPNQISQKQSSKAVKNERALDATAKVLCDALKGLQKTLEDWK